MPVKQDKDHPAKAAGPVRLEAAALHELCMAGNDLAWRNLFTWCRNKAAKMLPAEAEGVAQQVCLKLLEGGLQRVQNPKAFLGYVSRAVSNEVVNRLRARKGDLSLDQPTAMSDGEGLDLAQRLDGQADAPDEQAMARLMLAKLGQAMDQLPEYCRGVMRLYVHYRMGLVTSYKEMAGLLQVSVNTLGVQIKRCLDQLRRLPEFVELF